MAKKAIKKSKVVPSNKVVLVMYMSEDMGEDADHRYTVTTVELYKKEDAKKIWEEGTKAIYTKRNVKSLVRAIVDIKSKGFDVVKEILLDVTN